LGTRKHRQIGSRAAFDAMMGPSSLKEMMWAAKPDDPDAFVGRMTMLVPIGRHQQPEPGPEPEPDYVDHRDLPVIRGMIIDRVLSARTLDGCERGEVLVNEWLAAFPEDREMRTYGSFLLRMRSALLHAEDGPRAARGRPQSPDHPEDERLDV
jgi:hypothetical protein